MLTRTFHLPTHLCLRRLRHGTPPGSRPLPTSCLCAIFRREPCNAGLVGGGGGEDSQFRWTTPLLRLCLVPARAHTPDITTQQRTPQAGWLAPVRYCPVLQVYSSRLCVPHHPSPTRSPTHPRPRPPAHRRLPASCSLSCLPGCCWPRRRRLRPPPADRHFQSFPLSRMRVGVRGCRATTHKCSAQPAPPS